MTSLETTEPLPSQENNNQIETISSANSNADEVKTAPEIIIEAESDLNNSHNEDEPLSLEDNTNDSDLEVEMIANETGATEEKAEEKNNKNIIAAENDPAVGCVVIDENAGKTHGNTDVETHNTNAEPGLNNSHDEDEPLSSENNTNVVDLVEMITNGISATEEKVEANNRNIVYGKNDPLGGCVVIDENAEKNTGNMAVEADNISNEVKTIQS